MGGRAMAVSINGKSVISTWEGPTAPLGHSKQIRHCLLTRMLYWPARLPFNSSSRLRQAAQIIERGCGLENLETLVGLFLEAPEWANDRAVREGPGPLVPIAQDHGAD